MSDKNKVTNVEISDALQSLVGSENRDFGEQILIQMIGTLFLPEGLSEEQKSKRASAAIATLKELEPRNGVEGILAVQMVSVHSAAMECLRRAAIPNQTFKGQDMAFKNAQKMFRLYLDQVKALNKLQGRSDQKVVIEHVNVEAGGQAIVGNIEQHQRKKNGEK